LAGQTSAVEKKKSGKGWMICSIITLVLLIGAGVCIGILFFNRDDSKVADLEKTINEKDAQIAELEDSADTKCKTPDDDENTDNNTTDNNTADNSTANTAVTDVVNVDMNNLKAAAKQTDGDLTSYTDIVIKMAEGGKYIIASGSVGTTGSGYELFMYKENKAGATWKELYGTQAEIPCSSLNQEQKNVFHGVENCVDDEGHYRAL
jgi:hypothetical protein